MIFFFRKAKHTQKNFHASEKPITNQCISLMFNYAVNKRRSFTQTQKKHLNSAAKDQSPISQK